MGPIEKLKQPKLVYWVYQKQYNIGKYFSNYIYNSGVAGGDGGNVPPPETPENFHRIKNSSGVSQQ